MNKRAVIVSGGSLDDRFVLNQILASNPQYLIGADRGIEFFQRMGLVPTHILGDFDSVSDTVLQEYLETSHVEAHRFPKEKDATDTEIAIRLAIELGAESIALFGATGTRLDHTWGNIQSLKIAHDAGVACAILDIYNRISIHEKQIELWKANAFGNYFSLFPLGSTVEHVTIRGAKYSAEQLELSPYDSRCVSNEFEEEKVEITFPRGYIVLMETKDS